MPSTLLIALNFFLVKNCTKRCNGQKYATFSRLHVILSPEQLSQLNSCDYSPNMDTRLNYIFLWRQSDFGRYMRRNEAFAWELSRRKQTFRVTHIELTTYKQVLRWMLEWVLQPSMRKTISMQLHKTFSRKPVKIDDKLYAKSILVLRNTWPDPNEIFPWKRLVEQIQTNGTTSTVVVAYPPSPIAEHGLVLKRDLLVCDLVDDVIARESRINLRKRYFASYEIVLPQADIIIATGASLKNYENIAGKSIEVIRNGVDRSFFNKPLMHDTLPRKKIGYVGSINKTMNVELVEFLLNNFPDVTFVFAGFYDQKGKEILRTFSNYHNFQFIGELNYKDVPSFLYTCDILINPKRPGTTVAGGDSIKTYQYLATGKPVVTTSVPPALDISLCVEIHDDYQHFANAIYKLINTNEQNNIKEKRRNEALKHLWSDKIAYFEEMILDKLYNSTAKKWENPSN